jgi:hypothetical protein
MNSDCADDSGFWSSTATASRRADEKSTLSGGVTLLYLVLARHFQVNRGHQASS